MIPQLRSHAAIAERLIDHVVTLAPELTDFVEGGITRSLLDALAVVLQGVEYAAFDSNRQAILSAAFTSFQFTKLPAVSAGGTLTLTRSSTSTQQVIAVGFQVAVPGSSMRVYETIEEGIFAIGVATLAVPVRCLTVGIVGNTASNTVTSIVTVGFSGTVTNTLPFLSGREEETDEGRFQRFQVYVGNLARGTAASIENAVQSVVRYDSNGNAIERVVSVKVVEPFLTGGRLGLVLLYVDNGSGTTTAELKTMVEQKVIGYTDEEGRHPGWSAAGIEVRVFQVAAVAVAVTCSIVIIDGWNIAQVTTAVEVALVSYLNGLAVFAPVVVAELVAAVMSVDGVFDVIFDTPTANVTTSGRIVAGTIMVLT